jgi:hypothetical protein
VGHFRYWHITDALLALMNVSFEGKNGHDAGVTPFPLMTQSGHSPRNAAPEPLPPINWAKRTTELRGAFAPAPSIGSAGALFRVPHIT